MIVKKDRWYNTRSGARVHMMDESALGASGDVYRSGLIKVKDRTSWFLDGRKWTGPHGANLGPNPNDIVSEAQEPYATWMCKIGDQAPMPAPTEEIARDWARRGNGRAFRVMEVIE